MSLYAADGSRNVTVVDGTTRVGASAPDGSWNIFQVDGTAIVPNRHACGALNVFKYVSGQATAHHKSGATMVSVSPYVSGTTKVTVVSGALT